MRIKLSGQPAIHQHIGPTHIKAWFSSAGVARVTIELDDGSKVVLTLGEIARLHDKVTAAEEHYRAESKWGE